MSKNHEEVNVLDELSKGACMGRDAIHFIMDKVEDEKLKKELDRQYREYKEISEEINKIYPEYSEDEPHKTSAMNKMMTWYGIEMRTLLDKSTSKIAELLLQGTNMGIIEGRKLLNQNPDADEDIKNVLNKFIKIQENNVEKLKTFL